MAAVPAAVTRVEAVYAGHYKRLTDLFSDYSPEERAVIADWFTRATDVAHEYLEKLNRNDPDGGVLRALPLCTRGRARDP